MAQFMKEWCTGIYIPPKFSRIRVVRFVYKWNNFFALFSKSKQHVYIHGKFWTINFVHSWKILNNKLCSFYGRTFQDIDSKYLYIDWHKIYDFFNHKLAFLFLCDMDNRSFDPKITFNTFDRRFQRAFLGGSLTPIRKFTTFL